MPRGPHTRRIIEARAWSIARQLRARRGWFLGDASFRRSWSVHLAAVAVDVSAFVSLFFDSPGMVIQLTWKASSGVDDEEVIRYLQASLGEGYRRAPSGDHLATVIRTDQPKRLLAEIAHLERVLGRRATRRFGPIPRSQDRRRWHIVEALRTLSWSVSSLSFFHVTGDEHRRLSASIGVLVDSANARSGLTPNFAAWVPRKTKRWTRFCETAAAYFAAKRFRINDNDRAFFHAGRWIAGLDSTRARNQANELDEVLESNADLVAD